MIFVQRQGTVGTVTFTGERARILDQSGAVVCDWTAGGTIGEVPQGGGYTLQVATGSSIRSDALAIGAVVFTLGQSNIERWYNTPTAVPDAAGGTYMMEQDGTVGALEGGAATYFATNYAAAAGVPVLMVAAAKGGTALTAEADKGNGHWLDTSAGSLYSKALALLDRVGGTAEVVLWAQGETDASANVSTAAYAHALTTFMNRALNDFGTAKILIQEIGQHGDGAKYDAVRAAQQQVASTLAGVDVAAITRDLNSIEDGIHLSGASRVIAADRMLDDALRMVGIDLTRAVSTGDRLVGTSGRDELRGTAGADSMEGAGGSDIVFGGAGNDTILGGADVDLLSGDAGNDFIDGGLGADIISGGDGQDTIVAGEGDDEVWADVGDDRVAGGLGNDVLFGGGGTDTAVFSGRFAEYSVVVAGRAVTVRHLNSSPGNEGTDFLDGFEYLEFADRIYDPRGPGLPSLFSAGTEAIDFASVQAGVYAPTSLHNALAGDDEVYLPQDATAAQVAGYDPAAIFDAGSGNDVVIGGSLNDTIRGGEGDDILNGGLGSDRQEGGTGNDTYYVDVTAVGSTGDLVIERANEGIDTVVSSATHTLKSNVENLTLTGVADLNGTGNDLSNEISGNGGRNTINANAGNDRLFGNGGDDILRGGVGNDTIDGGAGQDIVGFAGRIADYSIAVAGDVVTVVDLNASDGDEGTDEIRNAEVLKFSDTSYFVPQANSLFTAGADQVDFVTVLAGAYPSGSQYAAWAGDDEVYLPQDATAAQVAGYDPAAIFDAGSGNDVVIGGSLNDTIRGGEGDDILNGGLGSDRLEGGEGSDVLDGGEDLVTDILRGGTGDDVYFVRSNDSVGESFNAGYDTVRTELSAHKLGSNVEALLFAGVGAFKGTGNALANLIQGGGGDDTLDGGAGDDLLAGGAGNDTYRVDSAGDRVLERSQLDDAGSSDAGGTDIILIKAGLTSYDLASVPFVENLTYTGASGFVAKGNDFNNVLKTGAGSDVLMGGRGFDILTGGAGADQFLFATAAEGLDLITDFSIASGDKIVVAGAGFGELTPGQALSMDELVIGTSATQDYAQFIFDGSRRALSWDADGRGSVAAIEVATFSTSIPLGTGDFLVI